MSHAQPGHRAILLLGPTGSGKTPFGGWIEEHGLWGRTCHHFDFGARLRALAAAGSSADFTPDEIRFLRRVLTQGALLEDESFSLAERILRIFISQQGVQEPDWLVLNGLPRHAGQAVAMDRTVRIGALIQFECPAHVVRERLRRDTGGDRAVRDDDHDELVQRKLALYEERTRPLLAHYQRRGARVIVLPVGVATKPADIAARLQRFSPGN